MATHSSAGFGAEASNCLTGGGEMGALMRAHGWAATPLGPVDLWPQSLRTSVSTCLNSRFAILIWWGPELVMLYNDAYREIIGSKHPAALGMPGRQCFPEVWDVIGPMLDAVLSHGQATRSDDLPLYLERFGYAEECYFTFSYSPIRDESGAVVGVFTPVAETTEKVIGTRRLSTLQELGSRRHTTHDVRAVCDSAARTLGANMIDVPFSATYLFTGPGHPAELVARSGAPPAGISLPAVLPENPEFPPESTVVLPLLAGQQSPAGFLVAGINPCKRLDRDYRTFYELVAARIAAAIAESRAYDHERRRAESLAELDRAKTQFFSNISHEFRTPLTLMLAPLEDLISAAPPDLPREELALVHRNGLRLLKLVNTLLDFSAIEAGRTRAAYQPTDLAALTSDIASCFRSAVEKAGLHYRVACEPLDQPVFVDREMWEKIVLNLISNAFKFTHAGEIAVGLRRDGSTAELTVRDSGVGIPPAELPRIFDRFHRVEGAQGRTHEGSGIGLAFVQELVKLHGGEVHAASRPGQGSTFTVRIPLGSGHLPAAALRARGAPPIHDSPVPGFIEEALRSLPEEAAAAAPAADAAARPRILVAEDNADMRDYLRRILESRYYVDCVPDGEAALAALRSRPFDLILSDVMMPRLDGFALVQHIRANPESRALPIVLLSARAGEHAAIEGLEAGADTYLTKPFTARDLLARVEAQLSAAQLRLAAARRERDLREHAERERRRWHSLIQHAPAAMAVLRGPDLIFEVVNDEYVRASGRHGSAEFEGRRFADALPELVPQGFVETLSEVYRSGQPAFGHRRSMKLNRSGTGKLEERFFNCRYQPIGGPAGEIEGVFVHSVDVTEEVLAGRRLEESEAQFRVLADSIPNLAWIADASGARQWFNRQWYEYTGANEADTVGWGWLRVHDAERIEAVLARYKRQFEAGELWEDTVRLRGRNGEYRWFLSRAIPLRSADGAPSRWFGTCTDVTFEIDSQRRIADAQRLESIGLLAGGIAHDFNNLLVPILGYASIGSELLPTDHPVQAFFPEIEKACDRAAHLTRQLLAYAGKTRFVLAHVDVPVIARETVAVASTSISRNVEIVVESSPSLPPVEADPGEIRQILMNLILNAAEAIGASHGTVNLRITLTRIADPAAVLLVAGTIQPGSYISLEVQDTGCGMDEATQAKIFEPFFTTRFLGRGLGLAAVAGIVRARNWGLSLRSAPGQGSTFRVLLRAAEVFAAAPADAGSESYAASAGSGCILVVDDEEVVRRTAQLSLERHGYRVLLADGGAAAIDLFRAAAGSVDLVLLDLSMPGMSGHETLAALQQIDPHVRALVSSGYSEQQALETFSGQHTVGFLQKPYTPAQLAGVVKKILSRP